ncbi:hypothetical protein Pse7367_0845 [Thalassoporum mexicanum PCC 7367]|uniref:hypothetical protein n=1 Tax=Thalassoporum mexicanum TaxID=3457544 RepID=UPI00029FEA6A|nr:hypothetical protein [Pseudanabaena sp. PCC 7367]AFY69145.1 hypothetical protein Pse7367_0845 [Pseudanabaena sp. PCC 7367]
MEASDFISYLCTISKLDPDKFKVKFVEQHTVRVDCVNYQAAQYAWKYRRLLSPAQIQVYVNNQLFAEKLN